MKVYNQIEVKKANGTVRLRVKNTEQSLSLIKELRKKMGTKGITVRIRGRHHDRKSLFKLLNKSYNTIRGGSSNDINFNSEVSKFCDEFVLYFFKKEKIRYSDSDRLFTSLRNLKQSDILFVNDTVKCMFN